MSALNKRIQNAKYIWTVESMFKCPICGSFMRTSEFKSLICLLGHTFDFTKQGSINLLKHPSKTKYDKALFESRRKLISEDGFFNQMSKQVSAMIINQGPFRNEELRILDMGTGEGSHLVNICHKIESEIQHEIIGVGIDISKEGILMAAKHHIGKIWCVADLAHSPFRDGQFDVILNILSPSNYKEFERLLKPGGLVVKIVPRPDYLKELREAFFRTNENHPYTNTDTVERFNEKFSILKSERIRYRMNLNHSAIQSLIQMTPLSWGASEERIESFLEKGSSDITIDLDILIAKKTNYRF